MYIKRNTCSYLLYMYKIEVLYLQYQTFYRLLNIRNIEEITNCYFF